MNENPMQRERVLDYMIENGGITQLEALQELGVMRLASRISELRKHGHDIKGETIKVKNRNGEPCRVKRYSIGSGKAEK